MSPWKDGLRGDFDAPRKPRIESLTPTQLLTAIRLYGNCDCADCRAIVALVEEETINKP